ncbi:MAG TPA: MXAN_5808 family serine peptidase [Myxococcaceae bacterium]|nr:MXAN_5808 family serine peptidase [Myxococcaceae bacterium]
MPRLMRRSLLVLALLGAWALLARDHAPLPFTVGEAVAGPAARGEGSTDVVRNGDRPPHDLSALKIFNKVVIYVKDAYVDPKRINPREMMVAALEQVERTVPDVMVEADKDRQKLHLNVNGKTRDFDISHVDSLWKMSFQMKDVFEFIGTNLRASEDTRDVEYAAVNGMLSTLDPHSVLLKPEYYREMRLTTKGEFGGLGFVIQMKESNLTVVRVLAKTPASRAGIKKDDQIKKIGEESTVNMDLNEAVSKLRGPVDSRVTITVERKGLDKPMVLTLARATISIESVQSKLLAGNVGYIRLKNFQGNTTRDMQTALGKLQSDAEASGGLKGLVLDLRGNPGGLLEQAIQVSDLFLSQGTIVTTVSLSERQREEKRAHADDGDNRYPLAVLVNPGSASASEIVAGALKNLNRAVIIGQQTFGKGSVQVLYEFGSPSGNPNDESALKLTIAKYLTPGDVSIQEVGIEPDIELVPTRVTADRVNVFAPRKTLGEADLEHHFGNSANNPAATKREEVLGKEKPFVSIRYLKEDAKQKDAAARQQKVEEGKDPKLSRSDKPSDKLLKPEGKKKDAPHPADADPNKLDEDLYDQLDAEAQDEVKEDFEVLFARDFVLKEPYVLRDRMLQSGKGYLQERGTQETERINTAIAALGVDWTPGPTPKVPQLLATLRPGPEKRLAPGDSFDLEVTVENKGIEPLSRIRAWTESEDPLLDRREFLFGTLKPGEKRTWKAPVKVPKDMFSRRDDVTVKFLDDQGPLPQELVAEVNFGELSRPAFALDWQVVDDCAQCNGDGVAQRGESVTLLVDVTNQGTGKALDAVGSIKNAADQNVFIEKGRFHLGEIAPGETKTARFQLEVKKGYVGDSFPLKLAIIDEPLEEFSAERLNLPLADHPFTVEARKGNVRVEAGAPVLAGPDDRAPVMARVKKAGVLPVLARVNGLTKVETEKGRFGFLRGADTHEARNAKAAAPELAAVPYREPPQIALQVDQSQGGVVAPSDRFTLAGTVTEPKGLLDMYVLVNDQKVFFRTSDSPKNEPTKLKFSADFPLKEGANSVIVVARQTQDFASRKVLIIRRRPAAVAQALARAQGEPTVRP